MFTSPFCLGFFLLFLSAATSQAMSVLVQCLLRALTRQRRGFGNMEWFVQTPEYSFKNTLLHSILLVVFSLERCRFEYTLFHAESGAPAAHEVS
jgi:hypothetical protein